MTRFLLQVALVLLVFAFALWKGGRPEKIVASTYLAMLLAGIFFRLFSGGWSESGYDTLQTYRFAVDLSGLCGVLVAALQFDRWWTLWVGSVQLIAVMAHLLRLMNAPLHPVVYAVMERGPAWIALIITAVGIGLYYRRHTIRANGT